MLQRITKAERRRRRLLALAFLFPGNVALTRDIGPALAARSLGGTRLEGKSLALGLGRDGVVDAQEAAAVDTVNLGVTALFELDMPLLRDEFLRRHVFLKPCLDLSPVSHE